VVHRPLALRGHAVPKGNGKGQEQNIDDTLWGLHVSGSDRGGRTRMDQEAGVREHPHGPKGSRVSRRFRIRDAPDDVVRRAEGHGERSVHVPYHLTIRPLEIDVDARAPDRDLDADSDWLRTLGTRGLEEILRPPRSPREALDRGPDPPLGIVEQFVGLRPQTGETPFRGELRESTRAELVRGP